MDVDGVVGRGRHSPPRVPHLAAHVNAHTHVIPVDPSLTVEEAWRELCIMGFRSTDTGTESWAVVTCDGEECASIQGADA